MDDLDGSIEKLHLPARLDHTSVWPLVPAASVLLPSGASPPITEPLDCRNRSSIARQRLHGYMNAPFSLMVLLMSSLWLMNSRTVSLVKREGSCKFRFPHSAT